MDNMKQWFPSGIRIFFLLLMFFIVLSLVPILIIVNQSIDSLDYTGKISSDVIESTVNKQSIELYKVNAQKLGERISDFLYACEGNLNQISMLPRTEKRYLSFSQNLKRRISFTNEKKLLFKEVAYIDRNGKEKIKVVDGKIIRNNLLKNVSIPKNTTYKTENYFDKTKLSETGIYISHLTGWYVSRPEQLEQGKSYKGLIRFCKKITDRNGKFDGICMIALDHQHLLDFVGFKRFEKNSLVEQYKTGSYTYILDDEGWIIAHQKLWDLRGLNKDGNLVEPLTEKTEDWKFNSGIIPINLFHMDWRLKDYETNEPMGSIINRVQRGETVLTTMKSMGIKGETEGIIRTRAYAPIFYSTYPYNKHEIFGAVAVGTSLKEFRDRSTALVEEIQKIDDDSIKYMQLLTIFISICVVVVSLLIAKSISSPLKLINRSLLKIAEGNFSISKITSPIIEINKLSMGVASFSDQLKAKNEKINEYVKDLEIVNKNLSVAKKELAVFLHQDYQIESDNILEEKIHYYENKYPEFKKIRNSTCIGNSPEFLRVLRQLVPQSQMTIPTWIYGESGVGKSALANIVHMLSPRKEKPFHVFPASEFAATDPMIVLGKLFGYGSGHGINGIEKSGQTGIIESCNGGTLLIDDIDSLPIESQAYLLRVLDGLPFHPAAGKSTNIESDVRFLFASHIDLERKVAEGIFRKDLFRRMGANFNKIEVPPLRVRRTDIIELAEFFIKLYCKKNNVSLKLSEKAVKLLLSHDYKEGNIGELKVLIEFACEMSKMEQVDILTEKHFPALQLSKTKEILDINTIIKSNFFNSNELKKLEELRKNSFRMNITEEKLGYMKNSKTLTHHFKGMCLKGLIKTNWQLEDAVKLITGSENDFLNDVVRKKYQAYIINILQKIRINKTDSLFNNLPKEYHSYLKDAIKHYQNEK